MPLVPAGVPHWVASPQQYTVLSDPGVAAAVGPIAPKPGRPAPKPLLPVPVAAAAFSVSVTDLLRELSLAYSPPAAGPFWATARWGLLRYFWAFQPPGAGLSLSLAVATLPFRLKGLLAEDFGVAMARDVMPSLVPVGPGDTTDWVSGELALGGAAVGPFGAVPLAGPMASPDYFFVVRSGGTVTPYAVEAKGTTGNSWRKQVKDAAHQLTAVRLAGPSGGAVLPRGFVISTEAKPTGLVVRVLDPEGDWSGPAGKRREHEAPSHQEVVRTSGREVVVDDPLAFRRDLLDLGDAQILGYAGWRTQAVRRVPARVKVEGADARHAEVHRNDLERLQTDSGGFLGTSMSGTVAPGVVLRAFYGVEENILDSLAGDDPVESTQARAAWVNRTRAAGLMEGEATDETVASYGTDGTIMHLHWQGR